MERSLGHTIGSAARAARTALGLTQADVAERIGVSTEFYARIERGGAIPSVPTLLHMTTALLVSADYLLGRTTTSPSPRAAEPSPIYRDDGSPELRRLQRRLRRANQRTLRLLGIIAAALEPTVAGTPRGGKRKLKPAGRGKN